MENGLQDFNTFLDNDFNKALNICGKNLTYEDMIFHIRSDDIVQKQYCILVLEEIKSKQDAQVLAENLSGQDSRIREVTALKINEFVHNKRFMDFFMQKSVYDKFLDGIIDVNANVCREIIEAVAFLKNYDEGFKTYFQLGLSKIFDKTFSELEKFDYKTKKYVISKKIFNLYWSLETLNYFLYDVDFEDLKKILVKSADLSDYTIREKVAKILYKMNLKDKDLKELAISLKNDENYYVKNMCL